MNDLCHKLHAIETDFAIERQTLPPAIAANQIFLPD